MASHAGTTPRTAGATRQRRWPTDAVCRAPGRGDGDSVGTIGNAAGAQWFHQCCAGRCLFSLDLRAPNNTHATPLAVDVLAELAAICTRRGVHTA